MIANVPCLMQPLEGDQFGKTDYYYSK